MSSRGRKETNKLKANLEQTLERLFTQLNDIEECKNDLDQDEYEATKHETLEQMEEVNQTLTKILSGDVTLVDEFSAMQIAIQAAISSAFKTPEVLQMFVRKQPNQLRTRLSEISKDLKLGNLKQQDYETQKFEILVALKKLGESLSSEEKEYIEFNTSDLMKNFKKVRSDGVRDNIINAANAQLGAIRK